MRDSPLPPPAELKARLARFRERLALKRLSGFLITDPANVRYLSGFSGEDSALLITGNRRLLLTDFRYLEEAKVDVRGWRIVLKPNDLMKKAGVCARRLRVRRLGVEAEHLTLAQAKALRKAAGGVRLAPRAGFAAEQRVCKSAWEVERIRRAVRIQERCFQEVCRGLRPGVSEREVAAELRRRMVRAGAEDQAFECIVKFGAGSSLPHGRAGGRRLRRNDLVLVDWGAKVSGYHSDLTRTFFMGRIGSRMRKVHEIVREAQARAKARVGPGVSYKEVDGAAREYITRAGYGPWFGHSTGHGLGLRIHEAPGLSGRQKGVLKPGMVVTVEPGIYLPGVGGVRIEDDLLVTAGGALELSRLPRGLRRRDRTRR